MRFALSCRNGLCADLPGFSGALWYVLNRDMYVRSHRRRKDGKDHTYYSIVESVRVSGARPYQRRVLYLGELNSSQVSQWERCCEVVTERGESKQLSLYANQAPAEANDDDVAEVLLSTLSVSNVKDFGDCWVGLRAWQELSLDTFWEQALAEERGAVAWDKVVALLAINRLVSPRSELFVHQKWFPHTAMDVLLGTTPSVAEKDRLYRCLDRIVEHKDSLEQHLTSRWRDMFGAQCDVLLYDLTSTYFEGGALGVEMAKRGYSRDKRGDCKQVLVALVVTPEGFPLTYEVFDGNRNDVTTLEEVLDAVEKKHGKARRIWVFDRGIVSEKNLQLLRERGGQYIVGTRKAVLSRMEQEFLAYPWERISSELEVKLHPQDEESYVLARSSQRRKKEQAMRRRIVRNLRIDVRKLQSAVAKGTLKSRDKILLRIGGIEEKHRALKRYFSLSVDSDAKLSWRFDGKLFLDERRRDGAYLLRTNLSSADPAMLWRQYIQLTEVEAAFRALKSELSLRPIWHSTEKRVKAHIMIAFLGYCLWVYLKRTFQRFAPGLTPWQALQTLKSIKMVDVSFQLRYGGTIVLKRITQPDKPQQLLLANLKWALPKQPPPRIYQRTL